jgi:hypothetical protein
MGAELAAWRSGHPIKMRSTTRLSPGCPYRIYAVRHFRRYSDVCATSAFHKLVTGRSADTFGTEMPVISLLDGRGLFVKRRVFSAPEKEGSIERGSKDQIRFHR